jgi:hypothetical protein
MPGRVRPDEESVAVLAVARMLKPNGHRVRLY